ncbi:hypothetical protein [Flavobacterium channae]|uniref:hypothetical protein n=1 Tax=Flavobacterium channae TaxID=2897181 RepID=UPI001E59E0C3|nr:hypothetical protein [Flavobacterium channae]UGS22443.1 hypothetical protein LOS89_06560 [Flavobacterium channae]
MLVALLGLFMRYKILFEFPLLDQKSLQHSHSHFAFAGWVTHTLITLLIAFLQKQDTLHKIAFKKYNLILIANLICSYVMLISFIIKGYGSISITFSTLSIFVSYWFAYVFFKDCKQLETTSVAIKWFKAALFFNVISSLGTFALAYMMATKNIHQNEYLASIYYYLHFQYNGWFFFACMGLLLDYLKVNSNTNRIYSQSFIWLFWSCIAGYFLSTLWLDLPFLIYVLTAISAIVQVGVWYYMFKTIVQENKSIFVNLPGYLKYLIIFISFALSAKFLLQLGSTVPAISKLAFGFRPIIIAYLHLILLAIISLFLLFYIYANKFIVISKQTILGLILFSIGVVLNEVVLGIQGIASLSYTMIPFINEALFGIALLLFVSILWTSFFIKKG